MQNSFVIYVDPSLISLYLSKNLLHSLKIIKCPSFSLSFINVFTSENFFKYINEFLSKRYIIASDNAK